MMATIQPHREPTVFAPDGLRPTREALAAVPKKRAWEARALPLRLEGAALVVAATQPYDARALQRLAFIAQRELLVVHAASEAVEQGLRDAYGYQPVPEALDLAAAVAPPSRKAARPSAADARASLSWGLRRMKVIAVTSGKGGVGKSALTANLSILLARMGLRVGVMDCDFGLSNLHLHLGIDAESCLSDVITGHAAPLEAFAQGPWGLKVLAGGSGSSEMAKMTYSRLAAAGLGFDKLDPYFDLLLLDTAAGIHEGVVSLLEQADEILAVMTPDPASIVDAYATTRVLLERKPSAKVRVVVNQAASESSARAMMAKFAAFLSEHEGARVSFGASIPASRAVARSVRERSPLSLTEPRSSVLSSMEALAASLAEIPADQQNSRSKGLASLVGRLPWLK